MKRILENIKNKFYRFMIGRYGPDQFSNFLIGLLFLVTMIHIIRPSRFLYLLSVIILIYNFFRIFSKNIVARSREKEIYLDLKSKIFKRPAQWKKAWKQRKTHRFYTCPYCKARIRIKKPSPGTKIKIACPKCKKTFEKRV